MDRIKTRFLRVFFFLLYHPLARFYDLVAFIVSLGFWEQWILSVMPELPGPWVLDLGHGPGHLLSALDKKDITTFGLDESHQMGLVAKSKLHKTGAKSNLIRGYAQILPFSDHAFSQIVATFPSEYITHPHTIQEAYRVLRPDGTFVILPSAWITGKNWIQKAAAWLFQVTDQAIPWDDHYLIPFREAGFSLRQKWINHDPWSLIIYLAEKSPSYPNEK